MWCQKLKKKTEREREREREQISSARLCISIHTMGLSQRLRLFLCYYMLLERANKRKLPQKISPDGSYQRHLHRQIKWAISLKTICMFPACYESALCQANSQFLNAQNIMRKKNTLLFFSRPRRFDREHVHRSCLQPRALRLSPCFLVCFLCIFFFEKRTSL